MKMSTLFLAAGFVTATMAAQAQTAPAPKDPLTGLQDAFGAIVGSAFHVPDQIAATATPGAAAALAPPLGGMLRTSLEVPGAAFLAVMAPLDPDAAAPTAAKAPARPAPAPHHRRAKVAQHRQPA